MLVEFYTSIIVFEMHTRSFSIIRQLTDSKNSAKVEGHEVDEEGLHYEAHVFGRYKDRRWKLMISVLVSKTKSKQNNKKPKINTSKNSFYRIKKPSEYRNETNLESEKRTLFQIQIPTTDD